MKHTVKSYEIHINIPVIEYLVWLLLRSLEHINKIKFYIISEELCKRLEEEANLAAEARACTGVLGIHPMSRDIKIDNFSVTFHGVELLKDTRIELSCGQRYGLIGINGSGKSTLLAVLGNREVPIQDHIDIYYLSREMPASEKTAIAAVMEADQERVRLEKLAEELVTRHDDESQEYLMEVSSL